MWSRENKTAINKRDLLLTRENKNLNKQAGPSVNLKRKHSREQNGKNKTDVKAAKKWDIRLRNGKRAACNHRVMGARGRLLSKKEA